MNGAPTACRRTVSGTISLLCQRCFSPFPHGTCSLSVSRKIFSLAGWSRRIRAGFHVSRATQDAAMPESGFVYGAVTRCGRPFQTVPLAGHAQRRGPTTPGPPRRPRFGLLPVRSPLLGESLNYFLFLRVLRCFSSPRKPPAWPDGSPSGCRVVPFGNPRIKGHLRLPAAYRSLSRPSSLAGAKASSVRPSPLSRSPRTRAGRRVSGTLSRPRLSIVSLGTALSRAAPPYSFLSVPVCQISLPPPKKGGDGGE